MREMERRLAQLESRSPAPEQCWRRVIVQDGDAPPIAEPGENLIVVQLVSPPKREGDGRAA